MRRYSVKNAQKRVHFRIRADADAHKGGSARGRKITHQYAVFFKVFVNRLAGRIIGGGEPPPYGLGWNAQWVTPYG